MFDLNGKPVPFEIQCLVRYFERAVFAFNAAEQAQCSPKARAILTAFCLHACQSFREAYSRAIKSGLGVDELKMQISYEALVEEMRNHDIHGFPLPTCDPNTYASFFVSNPDKPMSISSSHGVAVEVQMHGATPKVRRSPKDQKHGKFSPGQSISYHCDGGDLIVHDFSSNKDYSVIEVLRQFLVDAQDVVRRILRAKGLDIA